MHEALAHDALVAEHAQEPRRVVGGLGQTAVVEQAGVGVRGLGKPAHERGQQNGLDAGLARGPCGQRGEVLEGAFRERVAECCEL